jgi:hypothetical protein
VDAMTAFDTNRLNEMPEEKLYVLERNLKNKIEASRRKNIDTQQMEVEYCYLRREIDHRIAMHEAQAMYEARRPRYDNSNKRNSRPGRPRNVGNGERENRQWATVQ